MGRYSNWKTKLGLIAVLSAILVPVGLYTFGEAMPYLNLLNVVEDPSNMELIAMEIVAKEYDDSGNDWTSVTWRLDLNFTNPLGSPVIVPRASLSINYMDGILGDGWISQDYRIEAQTTTTVKAYMECTPNKAFDAFMKAFLKGQPLNLKADFEAYILIDGMLGEPYIGVKFPTVLNFPLPTEVQKTGPTIVNITRGEVNESTAVDVSVYAFDVGTGIAVNKTLYSLNGNDDWYTISMNGPAWSSSFKGTSLKKKLPITSSYPENPQEYTAQIPGQPAGTIVRYKFYFEDLAKIDDDDVKGNYMESEVYSYTVPSGSSLPSSTETIDYEVVNSFFVKFIDYVESRGINMLYWLRTQGKDLMAQLDYMDTLGKFFHLNNIDFEYWMPVFMSDFKKSVVIMEDSGVSAGKLLQTLDVDFTLLWEHVLDNICLEPQHDLVTLAKELWSGGVYNEDYSECQNLKTYFDGLEITNAMMYNFINNEFRDLYTQELNGLVVYAGHVIEPTHQHKQVLNILGLELAAIYHSFWGNNDPNNPDPNAFGPNAFMPEHYDGNFIWLPIFGWIPINPNMYFFYDNAFQNFIHLIATDDGTNYHLAAANYIMARACEELGIDHSEALTASLGSEIIPPGNPFPLDDLYPYTHQLSTICIFFPLAIVSYLVIKRELISHRNIKKDLAIKRTFKKKASTTSYK